MSVAGDGKKLILVPGYGDVTQAMLQRLRDVRHKKPMAHLPEERFRELVGIAERQLASAREIEEQAAEGVPFAVEAYTRRCDEARRAIWTAHDEPLARSGQRTSESNRGNASHPRRSESVATMLLRLSKSAGTPKELWPRFLGQLGADGMEPREELTPAQDMQVHYLDEEGRPRSLSFKRFREKLRELRKKR